MAALMYHRCILLFILINAACTERIKDMIYMPLDGLAACFRRHNGTHQFGCTSSRSGSVGVIHLVENEEDLAWLEKQGIAGPYTAVVPFSMFTRDTLVRLRDTNNINGILLSSNSTSTRPSHYSPDDTCPNRYSGFKECERPWNPFGSALFLEDWPFPMFYLQNQSQLDDVKSCFKTFNAHDLDSQSQRSLCAIEMRSFMYSAVDSETCIRRSMPRINFNPPQFCDPLGDRNIHWPLAPLEDHMESVILVTARLDSLSMFDGLAPGAQSVITGLITLITTANYLNLMKPSVGKTNVIFSLLNGESFDYIGSSRLVYDLKEGNFNAIGGKILRLDQIRTVIELGQLGVGDIYFHSTNFENDTLVNSLRAVLSAKILKGSLPPASIQSFLNGNPNISATVIANHGEQFTNKYYNSILDDKLNLNFESAQNNLSSSLNRIAITLASQLFFVVSGTNPTALFPEVGQKLILEMLDCYLENAECPLFQAASSPGAKLPNNALPLYVGVNRWASPATSLTGQVLALLTGINMTEYNITTCHDNNLIWMAGRLLEGICINSTVNYSMAISPAFLIDGYDFKSGLYSTWTESVWQGLSMRMFLKPAAATERLSMIIGSIVAIASFFVVWFIQSRADLLFYPIATADC
ncbi:nicastrin isoform X2 [Athalia rosae]|uniref:nicastrin isoform X2 n=1 Tax=Athalia rosae TaxID=37344 RepID=UPI002033BA9E|nr:nicastrin isoform X2 [Athalia rosae]